MSARSKPLYLVSLVAFAFLATCGPAAPTTAPSGGAEAQQFPPAPEAPIPSDPGRIAATLTRTDAALGSEVRAWIANGGDARRPPDAVVLLALYEQRVFGTLAADHPLARAVYARLSHQLAAKARANAGAAAALRSLFSPAGHAPTLRTQAPLPAATLLGYYRAAERRFGVAWQVLAAVNLVESKFGRVVSASSAGARGPMQFMPATWKAYGMGGNVNDPRDAIFAAANYLHASGAPGDYRRALYAYNPARPYVAAVMAYAQQMMHDPLAYYGYYNWQVFQVTSSGERRLTGPGPSP